jgi:hypothetical protein
VEIQNGIIPEGDSKAAKRVAVGGVAVKGIPDWGKALNHNLGRSGGQINRYPTVEW